MHLTAVAAPFSNNPTSNTTADPTDQNQKVILETNILWAGLLMFAAGLSTFFLMHKLRNNKPQWATCQKVL